MITPTEIAQKAARKYTAFLKAWLQGESFFPLRIPGKLASASTPWSELRAWQSKLMTHEKAQKGFGYTVILGDPTRTRAHGMQSLPAHIVFETQEDFLRLLKKEDEFNLFCENVTGIRSSFPQLELWLQSNPNWVIKYEDVWQELLAVCHYFVKYPLPGLYARELPIAVHSKFIEQHTDILRRLLDELLPVEHIYAAESRFETRFGIKRPPLRLRFRMLDTALQKQLNLPGADISLDMEEVAKLPLAGKYVIISENLIPYLTLPQLADSIAIFGEGNAVSALELPWLSSCKLLYWGDLDLQGLRFLSNLRSAYPHVQSIFMNLETLSQFRSFAVTGVQEKRALPANLQPTELAAYEFVQQHNLRLEQENIPHALVLAQIYAWRDPV